MAKSAARTKNAKAKSTKKFIQKGHLGRTIKERKQKQDVRRKIENRKALRGKPAAHTQRHGGDDEDEDEENDGQGDRPQDQVKGAHVGHDDSGDEMLDDETLQALLGDDDDAAALSDDDEEEDGLEDLEGEEEKHRLDIQALKEKDPEFYKYLQENDQGLLDFGVDEDDDEDDEDAASSMELDSKKKGKAKAEPKVVVVNKDLLKEWQKEMLQQRSLKALRKVLLAFRTAASSGEDDDEDEQKPSTSRKGGRKQESFAIQSAVIFNKVIVTALKYTPLVLSHHVPWKEMNHGRYKVPTQSKKYATAQRIIKSYFTSLKGLLSRSISSNTELLHLVLTDSSKLIPYIVGNRKISKDYLRILLEYWSSSASTDEIRVAAFLAIRKLCVASDQSIAELILKSVYLTLGQMSKDTNAYNLPSINLMKNSASTLFLINPSLSYQIGFSYIRQLAITLRNSLKSTSRTSTSNANGPKKSNKDAFKAVYNWTYIHSLDFWSLVLSSACDVEKETELGKESELRPLIYPLVQISLGVIKLVPTSRYYPLRFQVISSLLRLVQRTNTYVPLAPFLLEVFESTEITKKGKNVSSLKPLDWSYYIKAPTQYLKTKVYQDGLVDEILYLLLEFFSTQSTSIAFPELVLPITMNLKKVAKKSKNPKLTNGLKSLLERIESNAQFVESKRSKVEFSPQDREEIDLFHHNLSGADTATPLRSFLKLQRKLRDQKRELLEKAMQDDDEDEITTRRSGGAGDDEDEEDDEEMEEDEE